MRRRIGILGGLGPESTAAYYNHITRAYYEKHRDYRYPEIVIYSLCFQDYIGADYRQAGHVRQVIRRLAAAGADFVVAACNSIHVVYEEVCRDTPIPWVSIMDATAERIVAEGRRCVALLGTIYTMTADFYPRAFARHGLKVILPDAPAQERINRIIYDELVLGEAAESSRAEALAVIESLARGGAEGVVLGCTELPFLIQQQHTAVRVYDTTALHAQKALDLALGEADL
jgi:aspartate racemase